MNTAKQAIEDGNTFLGIEFGSTRIKAILIDANGNTLAQGSHEWENRLENHMWTYSQEDIENGLQCCYRNLCDQVQTQYQLPITQVRGLGISAMMHGYLAFDKNGQLLVPFRTWRNTNTGEAADQLTDAFSFQIPQRWSIAHLYQAILNQEDHVKDITYITTLAGFVHWKLTGRKVLGMGDAAGMFPIDSHTKQYHTGMMDTFQSMIASYRYPWRIEQILPEVLSAGVCAGSLTEAGARFLDPSGTLQAGCPLCPPEGDAGTGMVATNSVAAGTGNVSAGTSVFSMVVMDHYLQSVHKEIDLVTTPDGLPVAMVHCNNCTSDLNAWIHLFREFADLAGISIDNNTLYTMLFQHSMTGNEDCGGLLSYNFYSGEPVVNMEQGCPLFLHPADRKLTLANFMRTNIYSAFASLKIGMDILLKDEGISLKKITGHGGLFKTPVVGQKFLASALDTPVSVMSNAGEGGAWGMAVLAAYMDYIQQDKSQASSLSDYLEQHIFKDAEITTIKPNDNDCAGFDTFIEAYKKGLVVEAAAVNALNQ